MQRKANLNTDGWVKLFIVSMLHSHMTSVGSLNSKSRQVIKGSCCEVKKPNFGSLLWDLKEKKSGGGEEKEIASDESVFPFVAPWLAETKQKLLIFTI